MQAQTQSFVVPSYVNKFTCIGPACEDICCIGWAVDIDRVTYEKYAKIEDKELREHVEKNIKRKHNSSYRYGTIKMSANKTCPFLSDEHLCNIQLELGESALSDICSNYPRITNRVNGQFEKSAKMSCPEMARIALLNPEGIRFEKIEIPVERRIYCIKDIDTRDPSLAESPERCFVDLRSFTIQILQNRSYTISERLRILTLFYNDVDKAIQSGQLHEIPQLMGEYERRIRLGKQKTILGTTPTNRTSQLKILKEVIDLGQKKVMRNRRLFQCYTEFMEGIQHVDGEPTETASKKYQHCFTNHYRPFMRDHEYIFENYLVNYVFRNVFPFGNQTTVFREYTLMVVHYSLIRMLLIGMAGFHKGLTEELVIQCIQSYSRIADHFQNFSRNMIDFLDNSHQITPELIATCIS